MRTTLATVQQNVKRSLGRNRRGDGPVGNSARSSGIRQSPEFYAPASSTGYPVHAIAVTAQLIVAASVFYIWIFRFDNIVRDFEQFRYSPIFRNAVGVVKLVIATLMVVGIWMPAVVLGAALGMTILMLGAQWAHFGVSNPVAKRVPSALLLVLCVFVAAEASGLIG